MFQKKSIYSNVHTIGSVKNKINSDNSLVNIMNNKRKILLALIGICMPNAFVASNDSINEKQTRSLRKGKHQASEQWEPSQNVISMDHETVDYTVAKVCGLVELA